MLIKGSSISNRTEYLTQKYIELLNMNTEAENILVLLQNSFKKNLFIKKIKETSNINHFENPQIHTFQGLIYNTIQNYWPEAQSIIKNGDDTISPNLIGLEISQLFFKQAIKEIGFKDYNSKINLIHQLFRRNSLITNNSLSESEVKKRSEILNEVFADDAHQAIEFFKKKTLEYRAFDYIRQVNIFNYLYKNTDCLNKIKYLILDDADEITNAEFEFIKHLLPNLKDNFIGYDEYGSSRIGFLNADTQTIKNIESLAKDEKNIIKLDNLPYSKTKAELQSYSKRTEEITAAIDKVENLIEQGISAEEITIITPIIDSALRYEISERLDKKEIKYQYFSGSQKLIDTTLVENILNLLKISIGEEVDPFKIRKIISKLLNIPIKYCIGIIESFNNTGILTQTDLENEYYNEKLHSLSSVIQEIKNDELKLSEKIQIIYKNLILKDFKDTKEFEQLNFFVKQINDFEKVFNKFSTHTGLQKTILNQLENSIISENPSTAPEKKENHITIATAQKIIDFSIKTKYQIWLDISSSEWTKEDLGTLYNSWVFQKSWKKDTFSYEDNIELSKQKLQNQLRKLSILAQEKIFAFSSIFDMQGIENFGGIEEFFKNKESSEKETEINFNFTPRDDQKEVLNYKSGSMAISAVPGAGKTTILLALIIELLKNKINSENIFVLTYMDSAAKNFKERIKKACPQLEKLPNISTIHGLALRILKENSNYSKVNLNENFEVCDDNLRQKTIRETLAALFIEQDEYEKYEKAISTIKLSGSNKISPSKDKEIQKFLKFYNLYNQKLKEKNTIDYDDMLYLCVKLLEENKDIAEYYQELCKYVIEDEAQDSSMIQQKLIAILTQKHKNIIRCGDINQAITTTFTNADIEGFQNFVNSADKKVMMNCSQRCNKEIFTLANKLIDYSKENDSMQNAFFDIKMQEVKGKNPNNNNAIQSKIFNDYQEERLFLIQEIKNIKQNNKDANIAILVRNNYQIDEYNSFLSDYGLDVITKGDTLQKQPIFELIFGLLKYIEHPWDNELITKVAKSFATQKLKNIKKTDIENISNLKKPFILHTQDDFISEELSDLWWDLNYWLEQSHLNIENIVEKIGNYYYSSDVDKSNIYIISLLIKNIKNQYRTYSDFIERLEEIAKRPVMSRYNFFDNEKKANSGAIEIITYHKSKGDEFDYVFIPQLTEETLTFEKENIKIKIKDRFIEAIKSLNPNYKKKSEEDLKIYQINENLRLLYVAITRAKKHLYITTAEKYKKYSKIKDSKKSEIFEKLLNISK